VALKSDGSVVAWGNNDSGQTDVPPGLSNVIQIAAGEFHTVALKNDGTLAAWGYNEFGQVAEVPTTIDPYKGIANPVTLGGQVLNGGLAVAGGYGFTAAIVASTAPPMAPGITTLSDGNNLTLLWPASATGYRLEFTLSLLPPVIWNDVTGPFQTNGGNASLVAPITDPQKFYRLAKP